MDVAGERNAGHPSRAASTDRTGDDTVRESRTSSVRRRSSGPSSAACRWCAGALDAAASGGARYRRALHSASCATETTSRMCVQVIRPGALPVGAGVPRQHLQDGVGYEGRAPTQLGSADHLDPAPQLRVRRRPRGRPRHPGRRKAAPSQAPIHTMKVDAESRLSSQQLYGQR
jgi:hypothetical protein